MKRFLLISALCLVSASCGFPAPRYSESDYPVRSVTVAGETYGYRVYVPQNRQPGVELPVMLYLHGSNRRGSDNQDQISDLAKNIEAYPDRFSFIIVFPQC